MRLSSWGLAESARFCLNVTQFMFRKNLLFSYIHNDILSELICHPILYGSPSHIIWEILDLPLSRRHHHKQYINSITTDRGTNNAYTTILGTILTVGLTGRAEATESFTSFVSFVAFMTGVNRSWRKMSWSRMFWSAAKQYKIYFRILAMRMSKTGIIVV